MLLAACSSEEETPKNETTEGRMDFTVDEEKWTYISIEQGKVMGTSQAGNAEEEAQWKARKDWDIALCGDKVRTNSGTSGSGQAGIISLDEPYEQVTQAPESGYQTDTVETEE